MPRKAAKSSHLWDAIDIRQAFDELTKTEFACWVRLCTMTPNQLALGRNKIYKLLGYQIQRPSDVVMRSLANKGYLMFHPKGVGKPTAVLIIKRPRIASTHYFVKV